MSPSNFLIGVVCMAVSAAGFRYSTDKSCDFTEIDAEGAISRMLAKLPKEPLTLPIRPNEVPIGVKLLDLEMTGIHLLRRYGAVIPFCVNGTRMVQVDLANDGDVYFAIPWSSCTGQRGSLELRPRLSRFTTVLRVERAEMGEEVKLTYEGPTLPVTTEEVKFSVEGAGFTAKVFTELLSLAFPGVLRSLWNARFAYYFYVSISQALA
ncbi:uncharacterized protein LOC144135210 [Amblyomma americanum]